MLGDLVEDVVVWLDGPAARVAPTPRPRVFRSRGGSAANVAADRGAAGARPASSAASARTRSATGCVARARGGRRRRRVQRGAAPARSSCWSSRAGSARCCRTAPRPRSCGPLGPDDLGRRRAGARAGVRARRRQHGRRASRDLLGAPGRRLSVDASASRCSSRSGRSACASGSRTVPAGAAVRQRRRGPGARPAASSRCRASRPSSRTGPRPHDGAATPTGAPERCPSRRSAACGQHRGGRRVRGRRAGGAGCAGRTRSMGDAQGTRRPGGPHLAGRHHGRTHDGDRQGARERRRRTGDRSDARAGPAGRRHGVDDLLDPRAAGRRPTPRRWTAARPPSGRRGRAGGDRRARRAWPASGLTRTSSSASSGTTARSPSATSPSPSAAALGRRGHDRVGLAGARRPGRASRCSPPAGSAASTAASSSRGDVSADLDAIAHHPVVTVCAGAKAFLDLPRTSSTSRRSACPCSGWRHDWFPAFYTRSSAGCPSRTGSRRRGEVAAGAARPRPRPDGGRAADRADPRGRRARRRRPRRRPSPPPCDACARGRHHRARRSRRSCSAGSPRRPTGSSVPANLALAENNALVAAEVAVAGQCAGRRSSTTSGPGRGRRAAELDAEVRDRTRREGGLVRTVDRLRAAAAGRVRCTVVGARARRRAARSMPGADWLLLEERRGPRAARPAGRGAGVGAGPRARTPGGGRSAAGWTCAGRCAGWPATGRRCRSCCATAAGCRHARPGRRRPRRARRAHAGRAAPGRRPSAALRAGCPLPAIALLRPVR